MNLFILGVYKQILFISFFGILGAIFNHTLIGLVFSIGICIAVQITSDLKK